MTFQTLTVDVKPQWWMTANTRYHWTAKAERTRALRNVTRFAAIQKHLKLMKCPVAVIAHIQYPSSRRCDPNNANPTTKAMIDGLTDAGIWPDDDSKHVIGPDHRKAPGKAPKGHHIITLEIQEIGEVS